MPISKLVYARGVSTDIASVSPGLAATTNTQWAINDLTIQNGNARGGTDTTGLGGVDLVFVAAPEPTRLLLAAVAAAPLALGRRRRRA